MQVNTTYKDIWRIAFPVMIGSIAITVLNITDTIFLGRVGEIELGASALGGVFYFIIVMIGVAIATGTQIQIARRAGEKNDSAIGEIFDQSLILFLVLGGIGFIILNLFSKSIFQHIIKEEALRIATHQFLYYRSFGIFFAMLALSIRSFYVGIAAPKVWSYYSFIIAGVNIVLCYDLVFGKMGMPKMGIAGAGLASSVSEGVGLIFLFIYMALQNSIKQYRLFSFRKFKTDLIAKTLTLSAPLVVQNLLSMGAWFIFFVFIEKTGTHNLAISNIARSAYMINLTPIWGFSVAANSMVSNVIGQGRKQEVLPMINKIILMASLISLVSILLYIFIPVPLMNLFTTDQKLIADSLGVLKVLCLATFVFPFSIVCISSISGTGATRTALYIEVLAILIYLGYLYACVFVFHTSLEWAWCAEAIYWIFTGTVSYLYLRSMRWEKIAI